VAAPQESVRLPFEQAGIAAFEREREAMDALVQLADHAALMARKPAPVVRVPANRETRTLNEHESLALLSSAGLPVIEHRLCRSEEEAVRAASAFDHRVVIKACSQDLPHKSDHGLVALNPPDIASEFRRQREKVAALGARFEGVIVARLAQNARELALGARVDPGFGPVVLVGDGGIALEALKDFRLLQPPFTVSEVLQKLAQLRVAPLLQGFRGQPARDAAAFGAMAVRLGEAMLSWNGAVASMDINPVMVFETGKGAVAVDALAIIAVP
jgi:acyl-CoA synthetase (NDP forming)